MNEFRVRGVVFREFERLVKIAATREELVYRWVMLSIFLEFIGLLLRGVYRGRVLRGKHQLFEVCLVHAFFLDLVEVLGAIFA